MILQITTLTNIWNKETGQSLHPVAGERIFFEYLRAGFTPDDLETVLLWIKFRNKIANSAMKRQFNLRLVLDPYSEWPFEKFAIDLSEAKAWARNRKPALSARQAVVEQLRPGTGEQTRTGTEKTIGAILRTLP